MNENNKISDSELEQVSGGGKKVNQYDVRVGQVYAIYFPMQNGPLIMNPYGARSGHTYRIAVYEVFEAPGLLFGTNRSVRGIDIDNGEYVTVEINHDNVREVDELILY